MNHESEPKFTSEEITSDVKKPLKESIRETREKMRLTLKMILDKTLDLVREVQDDIVATLEIRDPDLDQFVSGMEKGADLGKAAGQFFRDLSEKWAMYPPEKNYTHEPLKFDQKEYARNKRSVLLGLSISTIPFVSQKVKRRVLDPYYSETKGSFSEQRAEGYKKQNFFKVTKQDESDNLISENVYNERNDKTNYVESYLQITNPKSKIALLLEELLPNGVKFVPASMAKPSADESIIEATDQMSNSTLPRDLATYEGTQKSTLDEFAFATIFTKDSDDNKKILSREIRYGNIAEPGKILSLLHEIAHSWQSEFYEDYGKYPYKEWLTSVKRYASQYLNAVRKGNTPLADFTSAGLQELGVIISDINAEPLGNSEHILKDLHVDVEQEMVEEQGLKFDTFSHYYGSLKVSSEKLTSLLNEYAHSERIAWANAIRVLRFLRQKGIDLEPALKTSEDIRRHMYPKLQSYDMSVEEVDNIERPKNVKRFAKSEQK